MYARQHGLRPFTVYQGRWSAADRDFEREIVPMCLDEGMALAPWGALGGGFFKTAAQREAGGGGRTLTAGKSGKEEQVSEVLEEISEKKGTLITSVALAYVMHKVPYVFPIVGGRKVEHLKGNIEALALRLEEEDVKRIDEAYGFEMGYPHGFVQPANTMVLGPEDNIFNARHGTFDYVVKPGPIPPHEGPVDKPFKNNQAPPV